MKLRLVPARQGFVWLRHGLMACWQQSVGYLGLMGMLTSGALLLMVLPVIGPLLVAGCHAHDLDGFHAGHAVC